MSEESIAERRYPGGCLMILLTLMAVTNAVTLTSNLITPPGRTSCRL